MHLLCTICARGGSKGFPGKNIVPLAGKPLLVHTIECAQRYGGFHTIVVSTDDEKIADIARGAGASVPFLRPAHLATDEASKLPVIRHAVEAVERVAQVKFDTIVDLQPTSPLTAPEDISGALAVFTSTGAANVVSVCPARRNPYWEMAVIVEGRPRLAAQPPRPLARRQDAPEVYEFNGAVYVWGRQALESATAVIGDNTALYVMPRERSIDIDSPFDLALAECIKRAGLDSPGS